MTNQLSSKLAALSVALLMNAMMFGSVAYLFNGQLHPTLLSSYVQSAVTALPNAKA